MNLNTLMVKIQDYENHFDKKEVTQLSYEITGFAIKINKKLGPGLLESIYVECLKYELERNDYDVKQQISQNLQNHLLTNILQD